MNARRTYLLLLRFYPKSFRQRYGAAMTETFIELHRDSENKGLCFWLFVVSDTIRAASVQQIDLWASDGRRVAVRWLVACTLGTVLCNAVGEAVTWGFSYLYHPYLEGA